MTPPRTTGDWVRTVEQRLRKGANTLTVRIGSYVLAEVDGKLMAFKPGTSEQELTAEPEVVDLSKSFTANSAVPASADSPGKPDEVACDGSYLYVCVDTDTWKRVALSTW